MNWDWKFARIQGDQAKQVDNRQMTEKEPSVLTPFWPCFNVYTNKKLKQQMKTTNKIDASF